MKIYFGWFIVALAVIANMIVNGMAYQAFGLFVLPVSAEYGLSRADMNTTVVLMSIGTGVLSPLIGRMLDFIPARSVLFAASALLGVSFIGLGLVHSVWASAALVVGPLAAGVLCGAQLTMALFIARWFRAQRGRAMTLSILGTSLGGIIVVPLVSFLIETQGWRTALLAMGAVAAIVMLSLALLIREKPSAEDIEPGAAVADAKKPAAAESGPPLKVTTVLRMYDFWAICLAVAFLGMIAKTAMISFVPIAVEGGLSAVQATSLISLFSTAALGGKLVLAVIADKIERSVILMGLCALGVLANVALYFSHGFELLAGSAIILGAASGTVSPVSYTLLADRFGANSFGTVRGMLGPITAVFGAVGARFAGEVYDRTGNYDLMFVCFIAVQILAFVLLFSMRLVKKPALQAAA